MSVCLNTVPSFLNAVLLNSLTEQEPFGNLVHVLPALREFRQLSWAAAGIVGMLPDWLCSQISLPMCRSCPFMLSMAST